MRISAGVVTEQLFGGGGGITDVAAGRVGWVMNFGYAFQGATQSSIRNASTGSSISSLPPTLANEAAIAFQAALGFGAWAYRRLFIYFDVTSYSSINALNLKLTSGTTESNSGEFIAVSADAFGGDGSSALTVNDYNNLSFATNYSAFKSAMPINVSTTLSLNSTAISDAETNDYLIMALIHYDYDYLNLTAPTTEEVHHLNFSTADILLEVDYN